MNFNEDIQLIIIILIILLIFVVKNFRDKYKIMEIFWEYKGYKINLDLKLSILHVINDGNEDAFLKLVKDITSKGFVRNKYKDKLVDLSNVRINLKSNK